MQLRRVPGHCFFCGTRLTKRGGRNRHGQHIKTSATRDHLIPKTRGGGNSYENIVDACFRCNNEKGSMTLDEYIVWKRTGRRTFIALPWEKPVA